MKKIVQLLSISILVLLSTINFSCGSNPDRDVIRIGVIMPMTGPVAWLGEQHKWGLDIALDEINNNGGIQGKSIELIYQDDKGDPKEAVSAFNMLVSRYEISLVFVVMSSSAFAIQPIADKQNIVLFANVGHPTIIEVSKWAFRNFITAQQEAAFMANYCISELGIHELGVLYVNDAYGESGYNVFRNLYSEKNGNVVLAEKFDKNGSDFRTEILKINTINPKALYLIGYGKTLANLLNQLYELKYPGIILGNNNFSGPPVSDLAKSALENTIFTAPMFYSNTTNKKMVEFTEKVKDRFNKEPQWNTAVEYDALQLVAKAIQESSDSSSINIRDSMEKQTEFNGVAGKYKYQNNREWSLELDVRTYKNSVQIGFIK